VTEKAIAVGVLHLLERVGGHVGIEYAEQFMALRTAKSLQQIGDVARA
jgi:hypothetical protein